MTFTSGSAGIYASGDSVGTVQTLSSVADIAGRVVKLASITVKDSAAQNSKLKLLFFDGSAPTLTDNVAFAFGSSLPNLIGVLDIDGADYSTLDGKGVFSRSLLEIWMKTVTADLSVACVTAGTPTYGSGGTVTVTFTFEY